VRVHNNRTIITVKIKDKAIPVTGGGGPYVCDMLRLPYMCILENWLTDDGEVVRPTRRPAFIPRKIPRTDFC
jgi:hypothetical protein